MGAPEAPLCHKHGALVVTMEAATLEAYDGPPSHLVRPPTATTGFAIWDSTFLPFLNSNNHHQAG